MDTEASSLMLLDEQTGNLNVSIPTGPVKDEIIGKEIPKTKGISGWVISNNKPFYSNNVEKEEQFWHDLSSDFKTRNLICVPLKKASGKPFGVLQAVNRIDDKPFEDKDIQVFEALAYHVGIAIERSKIYDKKERKLRAQSEYISELHHRLKNSLSVISGLIEFELDDIKDEKAHRVLLFAALRLKSLAKAHNILDRGTQDNELNIADYLTDVVHNVENLFEGTEKDIQLSTNFDEIYLDSNRSILCGLIINELLMNIFEYSFDGLAMGEVVVNLSQPSDDKIVMMVSNNGKGIEENKTLSSKPDARFIVKSFVSKLNGEIKYPHNPGIGSSTIISFPI
ncbi:GAF domain-containing protein [Gracilimonas sp.]|uniref:GAF domain-containing protein n=1 Tax=Gracilimonas sp. TaxID=1974203 RepID=UPI002871E1B6|nr:GAF domain-containing protein [Gracilimonas sp.]